MKSSNKRYIGLKYSKEGNKTYVYKMWMLDDIVIYTNRSLVKEEEVKKEPPTLVYDWSWK